jgi:hypothetical protein
MWKGTNSLRAKNSIKHIGLCEKVQIVWEERKDKAQYRPKDH